MRRARRASVAVTKNARSARSRQRSSLHHTGGDGWRTLQHVATLPVLHRQQLFFCADMTHEYMMSRAIKIRADTLTAQPASVSCVKSLLLNHDAGACTSHTKHMWPVWASRRKAHHGTHPQSVSCPNSLLVEMKVSRRVSLAGDRGRAHSSRQPSSVPADERTHAPATTCVCCISISIWSMTLCGCSLCDVGRREGALLATMSAR